MTPVKTNKADTKSQSLRIQPKLTVGAINSPEEKEADMVAEKVMRMPSSTGMGGMAGNPNQSEKMKVGESVGTGATQRLARKVHKPKIERKCASCGGDQEKRPQIQRKSQDIKIQKQCARCAQEEKKIQRISTKSPPEGGEKKDSNHPKSTQSPESNSGSGNVLTHNIHRKCNACNAGSDNAINQEQPETPAILVQRAAHAGAGESVAAHDISSKIENTNGSGMSLPAEVHQDLGEKIGADFSNVKIHAGSEAAQLSNQLGARAFTTGNNIYFNSGEYNPGTPSGKRLLAHELTHVVQQGAAGTSVQRKTDETLVQRNVFSNAASAVWDYTGGALINAGESAVESGVELAGDAAEWAGDQLESVVNSLAPGLLDFLRGDIIENVKQKIITGVDAITGGLFSAIETQGFVAVISDLLSAGFSTATTAMADNCAAIANAARKLWDFIKTLTGPALDRFKAFLSDIGNFLSGIWNDYTLPAWDAIKKFAGEAWDWVVEKANWLWDLTAPIRNTAERAWNWVKEMFGIAWGNATSAFDWLKAKAIAAWNRVNALKQPYLGPLKVIAAILVLLSPAGPFVVAYVALPHVWNAIKWVAENFNTHVILRVKQFFHDEVLPILQSGLSMVSGMINSAISWLSSICTMLGNQLTRMLGMVRQMRLFQLISSGITRICNGIQSGVRYVTRTANTIRTKVSAFVTNVWRKLAPFREFLRQILLLSTIGPYAIFDDGVWGSITYIVNLAGRVPCIKEISELLNFQGWIRHIGRMRSQLFELWHLITHPALIEERARNFLEPYMQGVGSESESRLRTALAQFGINSARHIAGILKYLNQSIAHLMANWWDEVKKMVWYLIWPFGEGSPLYEDGPKLWNLIPQMWNDLWAGNFRGVRDGLLEWWQAANMVVGLFAGWAAIGGALVGAILGAVFGMGGGAIPGAGAGFEVGVMLGEGVMVSMLAAETSVIAVSIYDLITVSGESHRGPPPTAESAPERPAAGPERGGEAASSGIMPPLHSGDIRTEADIIEFAYQRIANSAISLGIMGALFLLGAIGGEIAGALCSGFKAVGEALAERFPGAARAVSELAESARSSPLGDAYRQFGEGRRGVRSAWDDFRGSGPENRGPPGERTGSGETERPPVTEPETTRPAERPTTERTGPEGERPGETRPGGERPTAPDGNAVMDEVRCPNGHRASITEDGRIIVCASPCEPIRTKYNAELEANPAFERSIQSLESRFDELSNRRASMDPAEYSRQLQALEAELRGMEGTLSDLKSMRETTAIDPAAVREPPAPGEPGSPEHRAERWRDYVKRTNKADRWERSRWDRQYDVNMEQARRGNAAADAYWRDEVGWGRREVYPKEDPTRRLDIADPTSVPPRAIEYKTGYTTASVDIMSEVTRDASLVRQGWDITWVFQGDASEPLLAALRRRQIGYRFNPPSSGPSWTPARSRGVPVRPKLMVGDVNSPAEREADAVAESVARMPASKDRNPVLNKAARNQPVSLKQGSGPPQVNRKCAECAAAEKSGDTHHPCSDCGCKGPDPQSRENLQKPDVPATKINRSPNTQQGDIAASEEVSHKINNSQKGGSNLPSPIAADFGEKIGADFSNVRIHTDSNAADLNKQLGARAFATGNNIYFNQGEYNPNSGEGKKLLAHELTHVVQNGNVKENVQRQSTDTTPTGSPVETFAERLIANPGEICGQLNPPSTDHNNCTAVAAAVDSYLHIGRLAAAATGDGLTEYHFSGTLGSVVTIGSVIRSVPNSGDVRVIMGMRTPEDIAAYAASHNGHTLTNEHWFVAVNLRRTVYFIDCGSHRIATSDHAHYADFQRLSSFRILSGSSAVTPVDPLAGPDFAIPGIDRKPLPGKSENPFKKDNETVPQNVIKQPAATEQIQRAPEPETAPQANPVAKDFIPTCTRKIDISGLYLFPASQATFQPGSKQVQLIRILLNNILGDQYSEDLVEPMSAIILNKSFVKSGQFAENDDSYEGEKIDNIFIAIEPLDAIYKELEKRNIKANFTPQEFDQLYEAFMAKELWYDFMRMAKLEDFTLPFWLNKNIFDSIVALKPEILGAYIPAYQQYLQDATEENKAAYMEMVQMLFYSILEILMAMEAIRADVSLNSLESTQKAYQSMWYLPPGDDATKEPLGVYYTKVFISFIKYASKYPEDFKNAETTPESRVKLLSGFQQSEDFKTTNPVYLPPFPAFMVMAGMTNGFETIKSASGLFRMVVNSDSMFGAGIHGVTVAMKRDMLYNWRVYPMPASLKAITKANGNDYNKTIKETDTFVKNSAANLGTPVKTVSTGQTAEWDLGMGGFDLGNYIVTSTVQPVYESDLNWMQEPSIAGHPFSLVTPEFIADKYVNQEENSLTDLEEQKKTATGKDLEAINQQITDLKERQSLKYSDVASRDIADTNKLLQQALQLKDYLQNDIKDEPVKPGEKSINPFDVRLYQHSVDLYKLFLMISENYNLHIMTKVQAVEKFIEVIQGQLEELNRLHARTIDAESRFLPGYEPSRIIAGLVNEDDGNMIPLLLEVGLHPDSNPEMGYYKMKIVDVSVDSPKKDSMVYVGESYFVKSAVKGNPEETFAYEMLANPANSVAEAETAGIKSAMTKFGEDNPYALGLIKYKAPKYGITDTVKSITTNFEYFERIVAVLGIIVLIAGVVASMGTLTPAAAAVVTGLGIAVGVAGAVLAGINIADRVEKGTFEWDFQTAMDIISIVGAVAMVAGTVRSISIALSGASKVTKMMQMQRLEKIMFIYDVADFTTNSILIAGKYYEDVRAIKALKLPKDKEDELIASATYEALQQGAMMSVAMHGIGKQGFEFYKAKVENTNYKSWMDKGWIEHGEDGVYKVSPNAPPFIHDALARKGLPGADKAIDESTLEGLYGSVASTKSKDNDSTLSYTNGDRVMVCAANCEPMHTKYADTLTKHPELETRLNEVEKQLKFATENNNAEMKEEALASLQQLESEIKITQEKNTPKKPETAEPTAPVKDVGDAPENIPEKANDNAPAPDKTTANDPVPDTKSPAKPDENTSVPKINNPDKKPAEPVAKQGEIVLESVTPTTATGEVHEHKVLSDGTIIRCSDKCSKLVDNASERSGEISRFFGKEHETSQKAKELVKKAKKLKKEAEKIVKLKDAAEKTKRKDALEIELKNLELELSVLEKAHIDEVKARSKQFMDEIEADLLKYPEHAATFDERLKNRKTREQEIEKKLSSKKDKTREEGFEELKHELDLRKALKKDINKHVENMKKPDVSGNYTYGEYTDSKGNNVKYAAGELGVPGEVRKHRNQSEQSKVSTGSGDDAGHLIANQFGAAGDAKNLGKQNWRANEFGTWRKLEKSWADKLQDGIKINVVVTEHTHPGSDRPYKREVRWTETDASGNTTHHEFTFGNFSTPEGRAATKEPATANLPAGGATIHDINDQRAKQGLPLIKDIDEVESPTPVINITGPAANDNMPVAPDGMNSLGEILDITGPAANDNQQFEPDKTDK